MEISVTERNSETGEYETRTVELDVPEMSASEAKFYQDQDDLAEACGEGHGDDVRFYDDHEHPLCSKHCYTCIKCGGIVQIG